MQKIKGQNLQKLARDHWAAPNREHDVRCGLNAQHLQYQASPRYDQGGDLCPLHPNPWHGRTTKNTAIHLRYPDG